MADKTKPKLSSSEWDAVKPICEEASGYTEQAIQKWAKAATMAVGSRPHSHWRWVLADMRDRCSDKHITCEYSVVYLKQLAETDIALDGDWDRGDISPSVLIEGRNHPKLLSIIKKDGKKLTVVRMKAHIYKDANKDARSIDQIEAELRGKRDSETEVKSRRRHAEKIEGWSLDKAHNLLPTMKAEIVAYRSAILRLHAEGEVFDTTEIMLALDAVKQLEATLDAIRPTLAKAA